MDRVPFRERLAEAMQLKGLRQVDIVKRTGVSKALVSRYLHEDIDPMSDTIFIFAQALNVNPAWLMGLNVPMQKPEATTANLKDVNTKNVAEIVMNPRIMSYVEKLMELPDLDKELIYGNIDMLYNRIAKDGE